MHISDIKRVVDQVSRDKGIDREVLIRALEEALKSAARKKFGNKMDIEVNYSEESGEIEVFQFKDVAEEVTEPALEISLEEGRKLDPDCEIGDSLGTKMDTSTFGRIAAQSAKQVIIQKMKDAEKDAVFSSYIDRKGEVINGIVQRLDRGDIIVNLGHTEGVVPVKEQVPRESYRRGDRIRAYILDVLHETRGPQIILSRTHPNFLIHLFRTEVPEITEGIVNIMGASREPGIRAKIAVISNNSDIDPVGACVGMRGSRVQAVVNELQGEKIDIIPWNEDVPTFLVNALQPAEVSKVVLDEDAERIEVVVPEEGYDKAFSGRGSRPSPAAIEAHLQQRNCHFLRFDDADLNADFHDVLDSVVLVLQEFDQTLIVVAGHTDSRGSDSYNQGLSERRAQSVADYLLGKNVVEARIDTVGFGERNPIATNDTDQGRSLNRRVELSLLPITEEG